MCYFNEHQQKSDNNQNLMLVCICQSRPILLPDKISLWFTFPFKAQVTRKSFLLFCSFLFTEAISSNLVEDMLINGDKSNFEKKKNPLSPGYLHTLWETILQGQELCLRSNCKGVKRETTLSASRKYFSNAYFIH